MPIPEPGYTIPRPPTVQRRADLVDRDGLEDVQCDLDYVPQREIPEGAAHPVFIACLVATVAGTALTWVAGHYALPFVLPYLITKTAIVAVSVLAAIVAVDSTESLSDNLIRVIRNIWISLWMVAALAAVPYLLHTQIAIGWLALVAMPVAIRFAYRFTTFSVHWITGHPLGDGMIMIQCRELWQYRYEGVPTSIPEEIRSNRQDTERWSRMLRAVRGHDYGFLWCYGAPLTGMATVGLTSKQEHLPTIGLQFATAILMALLAAALIRCDGRLPLRLIATQLLHWFRYDADGQATPWMFQSPCGGILTRSWWARVTLGVLAVAFNNMAGGYATLVIPASGMLAIVYPGITQPIVAVLIAAALCFLVPATVFALLLCIVAGPALQAFDELYSE